MIRFLFAALALGVVTFASAQTYTIGNASDGPGRSTIGQSFTPTLSGIGFPDAPTGFSSVTLNAMAFSQWYTAAVPSSIFIIQTSLLTDAPDFSAMLNAICANPQDYILGESSGPTTVTGLVNGNAFPNTITSTFTFTGLMLQANTSYTALFSNASSTVNAVANADAYLGGALLSTDGTTGQFEPGYDAVFSVTLTPSPIPESSTYATVAGLLAVAGVWVSRRRQA